MPLFSYFRFVGRAALPTPTRLDDFQGKFNQPVSDYNVIARRAKPDVAIRIPSGAKHRPSPDGRTERKRIATSLRSSQ